MDHLWKATREKLLSGKNNFRNENDLLSPFVTFVLLPLVARYAGTASETKKKKTRNHFIKTCPTVPSGSPSEWRIAYWSKSTDLLFELCFIQQWCALTERDSTHRSSQRNHRTKPLRFLSDDFLWVKKIFNFLASFVFVGDDDDGDREEARRKKKSWNYDDLIRKVRNNEGFLMRNFHLLPQVLPPTMSLSPFATVNWPELLCFIVRCLT